MSLKIERKRTFLVVKKNVIGIVKLKKIKSETHLILLVKRMIKLVVKVPVEMDSANKTYKYGSCHYKKIKNKIMKMKSKVISAKLIGKRNKSNKLKDAKVDIKKNKHKTFIYYQKSSNMGDYVVS
ncbi:hypothetical protein C2G38_2154864 [Gigaspora rosea]|uniref:Uncharacterized protein n=1 Tax=Gigaspora rosea TaxID=44941 RepID=A0A397WAL0_9GLOM|nr:hypothetical protein C2G38_2154864 [Gigaspora rosea]